MNDILGGSDVESLRPYVPSRRQGTGEGKGC